MNKKEKNSSNKRKNPRKRKNIKKRQEEIKTTKELINKLQKSNEQTAKTSQPKTQEYKYIIPNEKNETSTLTQFVCLECYSINLLEESIFQSTALYEDKNLACRVCKKITPQMCIKDKMLTKAHLEMTVVKTPEEQRAHQILNKKRKTNNPKQKIKSKFQQGNKR